MIGTDEARRQAEALRAAAEASPLRQYRYELGQRAREWENALQALSELEGEGVIELIGAVGAGMWVHTSGPEDFYRCIGTTRNGSLMLESPVSDRAIYVGRLGSSSPVVVKA